MDNLATPATSASADFSLQLQSEQDVLEALRRRGLYGRLMDGFERTSAGSKARFHIRENAAKLYVRLGDQLKYFDKEGRLTTLPSEPGAEGPGDVLGRCFFKSRAQLLNEVLKGWTRHRLDTAMKLLRKHGLVVTQTSGMKTGPANYFWLVDPGNREARGWAIEYNAKQDASNRAREHRRLDVRRERAEQKVVPKWSHSGPTKPQMDPEPKKIGPRSARATEANRPEHWMKSSHQVSINQLPVNEFSINEILSAVPKISAPAHDREIEETFGETTPTQQPPLSAPLQEAPAALNRETPMEDAENPFTARKEASGDDGAPHAYPHRSNAHHIRLSETYLEALSSAYALACQRNGSKYYEADLRSITHTSKESVEQGLTEQLLFDGLGKALAVADHLYWRHQRRLDNHLAWLCQGLRQQIGIYEHHWENSSEKPPALHWDPSEKSWLNVEEAYFDERFLSAA